jgi:molybdenum cofactor cytidylyltransferase
MKPLEPKVPRIAAIVLAAGRSTRMGRCKSLLPVNGKPVLAHVLQTIISIGTISPVAVVTGHEPLVLEPVLQSFDVERVYNPDFEPGGMISSIKAGLRAVRRRAEGVFIVLGVQPLVRPGTVDAMVRAFHSRRPRGIIPMHGSKRGHPVLLSADGIDQILALAPGQTLSDYTAEHHGDMHYLQVDDPAILLDLDTPTDYDRAAAQVANLSSA